MADAQRASPRRLLVDGRGGGGTGSSGQRGSASARARSTAASQPGVLGSNPCGWQGGSGPPE
eukprot:5376502-Lingulodinium_polyedra.AAC.1